VGKRAAERGLPSGTGDGTVAAHTVRYNTCVSEKKLRIYFSGIGGSGVSAIAGFMHDAGHFVAGSDRAFDEDPGHPVYRALKKRGITIVPQDGSGLDESYDFAVMSTAVEEDTPEVKRARALGLPVKTRPEYLAELVASFRTVAIAGTSGKSTVAGMLAYLMRKLGLGPNFIGGGRVRALRESGGTGNYLRGDSDVLVVEACESDGSIVTYRPEWTVLLNLSLDHHHVEETAGMFRTLLANTAGTVVANADDENLKGLLPSRAVTFSLRSQAAVRATDIVEEGLGTEFTVEGTRFRLSMPGFHNVSNALASIAVLMEMGVSPEEVANVLPGFSGIERRFDIHLDEKGKLVIDDYAHNPHKLDVLMQTMRALSPRVCYVFQPHGFSPTRLMKTEYIDTFSRHLRDGDHLVVLPIFYAGGTVEKDIASEDLASGVRAAGGSAEAVASREDVPVRPDAWDAWVVLGARDETLSTLAGDMASSLKKSLF
jgi:UDP-N-acetylmuramate--alanine ligase